MAAVKAIPPQSKEPSLKKVAAYRRVSTKSQEQLDSLDKDFVLTVSKSYFNVL